MTTYSILHSFDFPTGALPQASVIVNNGILYGTTTNSGANNSGTLFSCNLTGGSYQILHSFGDPTVSNDGTFPVASVIVNNGILYGTTPNGGANSNNGTLFSYDLTGGSYQILHNFGDLTVANDGTLPAASVIVNNGILYGTTQFGGANFGGALFSYDLTGGSYQILHSFGDPTVTNDGTSPVASVIVNNGILYGTTKNGGANSNNGTLFSCNLTGGSYQILHSFGDPTVANDGSISKASVIVNNGILYGTTKNGGANSNNGTLFSCNLTGGSYQILHSFGDPTVANDGTLPQASVIVNNGILYGTTTNSGANNAGTLFSCNLTGGSYQILHSFGDLTVANDGTFPVASVIVNNGILYGTTQNGGANSAGTLFSYELPAPGPQPITNICFPAGTPIQTDQGIISIDLIDPEIHTIKGQPILYITKTTTLDRFLVCFKKDCLGRNYPSADTIMTKDHKVEYEGKLVPAYRFASGFANVKKVKYSGEILYNVLLRNYSTMSVNNMLCETLHPNNFIAKLYTNSFTDNYNDDLIDVMNYSIKKRDYYTYKRIVNQAQYI